MMGRAHQHPIEVLLLDQVTVVLISLPVGTMLRYSLRDLAAVTVADGGHAASARQVPNVADELFSAEAHADHTHDNLLVCTGLLVSTE